MTKCSDHHMRSMVTSSVAIDKCTEGQWTNSDNEDLLSKVKQSDKVASESRERKVLEKSVHRINEL